MTGIIFLWNNLLNFLIGFPGQRPGGLLLSVILAVLGLGLGLIPAILVGSGRDSRFWLVRRLCQTYVNVLRGIPFILLILLVYQVIGTPRFGLDLNPRAAALTSLALYSSAYQAETVRSGLRAIPAHQIESARVIGASSWQAFIQVKLPYAFRVMLPAFTGQAISLFKDTSVLMVVGVSELMTVSRSVLGSDVRNNAQWVAVYLFVGFLYFCVSFGISRFAQRWEQRVRLKGLVHSLANY